MKLKYQLTDEILDYQKIAKDFKIPGTFKPNVDTHIVTLDVEKWPTCLTNLIRYTSSFMYPTKRIKAVLQECSDEKIIIEPIILKIGYIKVAHDCPVKSFTYSVQHNEPFDEPKIITMADSEIGKYINPGRIFPIEKGKHIVLSCEILESTNAASGSTHLFVSTFDRTQLNEDEILEDKGEFWGRKSNSGKIIIKYVDNISGENMFDNVKKILYNYFDNMITNFDKYFKLNINTPYLLVPNDRGTIIANCISVYVYSRKRTLFSVTNIDESIITYPRQTDTEIRQPILDSLTELRDLFTTKNS